MTYLNSTAASLVLGGVIFLALGCKKHAPPQALPAEQAPAALAQAFSKAKPDIKKLADEIVAALQNKDYAKAQMDIQSLSAMPGVTDEQRRVATACLLTAGEQLQAAQARGDEKAAEAIKLYQMNK